eukprot:3301232-Amphidinium_carterae.1
MSYFECANLRSALNKRRSTWVLCENDHKAYRVWLRVLERCPYAIRTTRGSSTLCTEDELEHYNDDMVTNHDLDDAIHQALRDSRMHPMFMMLVFLLLAVAAAMSWVFSTSVNVDAFIDRAIKRGQLFDKKPVALAPAIKSDDATNASDGNVDSNVDDFSAAYRAF